MAALFESRVRIMILGDVGVGKTSLRMNFVTPSFKQTVDPTDDLRRRCITVDGIDTIVEFHDIDVIRSYSALREKLIRESEAAILVYDVTSRKSFDYVQTTYDELRSTESSIKDLVSKPLVFCMVGNKIDRSSEREVQAVEGEKLAAKLGCQHWEVLATEGEVDECLIAVVREVHRQKQSSLKSGDRGKDGLLEKVKRVLRQGSQ